MDDAGMNVAEEQPQVALQSTATDDVGTQEVVTTVDVDKTLYVRNLIFWLQHNFFSHGKPSI